MLCQVNLEEYNEISRLIHCIYYVRRLERDCSGLLGLGRTQTAATLLHSIFREKTSGASAYVKSLLTSHNFSLLQEACLLVKPLQVTFLIPLRVS